MASGFLARLDTERLHDRFLVMDDSIQVGLHTVETCQTEPVEGPAEEHPDPVPRKEPADPGRHPVIAENGDCHQDDTDDDEPVAELANCSFLLAVVIVGSYGRFFHGSLLQA